jgi:gliding motility-associated-like protein
MPLTFKTINKPNCTGLKKVVLHYFIFLSSLCLFQSLAAQTGCQPNFFIKSYVDQDSLSGFSDITKSANNDLLAIAVYFNSDPVIEYESFIIRFDSTGQKIWEKSLAGPGQQYLTKIISLRDNNFLIAGIDGPSASYFLMKIDINGNVIWKKHIIASQVILNPAIQNIYESPDGSIYIHTSYADLVLGGILFTKCNALGDVVYSKLIQLQSAVFPLHLSDLTGDNNYSFGVGWYFNGNTLKMNGLLYKIDNSNGNMVWFKLYDLNSNHENFLQVFIYPGNRLCILGEDNINSTNLKNIYITDTSGLILSNSYFTSGEGISYGNAAMDNSGNLIWGFLRSLNGNGDISIIKTNPLSGLIWSKKYPQLGNGASVTKVMLNNDGSFYTSGYAFPNMGFQYIGKFRSKGETDCNSDTLQIAANTGNVATFNFTYPQLVKTFQTSPGPLPVNSNFINLVDTLCFNPSVCDTIDITGNDTLCGLTDTVLIISYRNPQCQTLPVFTFDNSYFTQLYYRNDSAAFLPLRPGRSAIYAELHLSCDTLIDSIFINVFPFADSLNLGSDTSLCPINTKPLNAATGYVSYLWQDGSTNTSFVVTTPGIYWLQVTDHCNNIYRDSVIITAASPIPFDIGPNLTKCNTDSLTITAPAGFLNYYWSPAYNINSTSGQSVIVFPSSDTLYSVAAEKTPGCFAYDSIRIKVNNSAPINLGIDTSFCAGDSLILNAGSGFVNYSWSNGSNAQSVVVKSTGTYSVIATDNNNCRSKDTLRILNIFNTPVINLPGNGPICFGTTATLNAGTGFTSYNWNTGETTPIITVTNTGIYWVTIIDINGCKNSDTTRITALIPSPVGFLPADTFICTYSKIQLTPSLIFKTYLWNTGVQANSIQISEAGTYWLQVTDNNDCAGRDSIIISPKQCLEGFYIPSGFTPNNDGLNDDFKPFLFGNVISYRFSIYNRWGEKVFESSIPGKGWNGKFKGVEQSTNAFVWQCSYQLENKKIEFEKGTVILIK